MYLPIFRGRQFELLALRECVEKNILSNSVIPIIEPVKVSSTYIKTVEKFIRDNRYISIILNPQVGTWNKDITKETNVKAKEQILNQFEDNHVILALYVTPKLDTNMKTIKKRRISEEEVALVCQNPDYIEFYENVIGDKKPLYNIIPDKGEFRRRIRPNRIMCEDHFPKQTRNVDYLNIKTEFFSADHLYYADDGYKGFSDYSVVGEEYSETGFAPYAVAIHIVYFDEKQILRIAHFVSDSNDDISDPARKFAEAVGKLVEWNKVMKLNTWGIKAFETAYRNETYPGLGVVKKYSIMHHLELISRYLDGGMK